MQGIGLPQVRFGLHHKMPSLQFRHTEHPLQPAVLAKDTLTLRFGEAGADLKALKTEVYPALQKDYSWQITKTPDANGFYQVHLQNGTQPAKSIARIKPGTTPVRFFHGPGGTSATLTSAKGLQYMAFPGSSAIFQDGTQLDMLPNGKTNGIHPSQEPYVTKNPGQTVTNQAFVAGAGIGTRILPITDDTGFAKPALPLDEQQNIIGRIADVLKHHGIQNLAVNTSIHRESVKDALKGTSDLQVRFLDETRATGTAGGVWELLVNPYKKDLTGYLDPHKPLLVVQGDAVTNANFSKLLTAHVQHNAAVTIGGRLVSDEEVEHYGIIGTDRSGDDKVSGRIQVFKEKPKASETSDRLASTGFYVLSPEAMKLIPEIYKAKEANGGRKEADGRLDLLDFAKDIFPVILEKTLKGEIKDVQGKPMAMWAQQVEGFWTDIGNPGEYLQTLRNIYEGGIFPLKPGTKETYVGPHQEIYWPGTRDIASKEAQLKGNILVTLPRGKTPLAGA